jgi:LPS sulfotransferase NodH
MLRSFVSRRGYLVCGERRGGSSFLVRTLMSTGLLGYPFEYFSRAGCRREMRADPERGVASFLRHASTPNGVYGAKLFSDQFDLLAPADWIGRLPGLHFVHLERADLLGQAISTLRAAQTRQYMSGEPADRPPRYDARAIAKLLRGIAGNQARWRAYFARNGVVPLQLLYEDVAEDPQAVASAIGRRLGLEVEPRIEPARVRTEIQRDALSREWRERFLAEAGGLASLDPSPGAGLLQPIRRLQARLDPRAARDKRGWTIGEPERPPEKVKQRPGMA